jgi:hypothetical protein
MGVFDHDCPDEPLPLVILIKGSDTAPWETLAKAAIPMLLRPEKFSLQQRNEVAEKFRQALQGEWNGDELDHEQDYQPGECLDWPEWEESP